MWASLGDHSAYHRVDDRETNQWCFDECINLWDAVLLVVL